MRRAGAVAVLVLAIASGSLAVLREWTLSWSFLEPDEVELGMRLRSATPPDARFLTADKHNHPVPIVAGRPIVLGYRGWLWTHGASTDGHLRDVSRIYQGHSDAPALLRRYEVAYVVVGPHERRAFRVDEDWFRQRFPLLVSAPRYRVYRVDGGAGADAAGSNATAPAGTQRASRSASK